MPVSQKFFMESINLLNLKIYIRCLRKIYFLPSKKNLKHFPKSLIRHYEYCLFLLFLARQAYLSGNIELATFVPYKPKNELI